MDSVSPAAQRHRATVRLRLKRWPHVRAGRGSITWQVNREVVVVAGWGRAILLQLAHPSVAAGVHGHSTFRGSLRSSLRRLHGTVGAMLSITFGTEAEMVAAAAGINAIHDRVRGHTHTGTPYSAHDDDLQRWVHATLLDSIPLVYTQLVGPLTAAQRDQLCAEATIMEPLLGMPPGTLPRSADQLDTFMREMCDGGTLVVTDTSRALARAVLYPPHWYLAWPAFRPVQLLTIGTLPPTIREAYGFTWSAGDERALSRWITVLRVTRRLLPPFVRQWRMAR
jgi:uncharacterized protein (DUF2236 family)